MFTLLPLKYLKLRETFLFLNSLPKIQLIAKMLTFIRLFSHSNVSGLLF